MELMTRIDTKNTIIFVLQREKAASSFLWQWLLGGIDQVLVFTGAVFICTELGGVMERQL